MFTELCLKCKQFIFVVNIVISSKKTVNSSHTKRKGIRMKISFHCYKIAIVFFMVSFFLSVGADFKLGVENISPLLLRKLSSSRKKQTCTVGLITNQTGVDQSNKRTCDVLKQKGFVVQYIFAPEHGLNGTLAERDVHDAVDGATNIPIISLYGNGTGKMIAPEYINNIDALIFDIQDSGMRHYTYISTLFNTMKIAQEYNKPYVVLDRPNPLGGMAEGPLVDQSLISFISVAPIPLRHGMTIGEVARYFNQYVLQKPMQLHVVPMKGYDRAQGFSGTFIHQLSPNLQSLPSCYGYSFLGLLGEIEPFDVGVGTPMAFQCITLPEAMNVLPQVWQRLQKLLATFGINSFLYRHVNPKNNRVSKGLRLEFSTINHLRAFDLFMKIMKFFKKEGISFSFSAAFNKAVGTKNVQDVIAGKMSERLFMKKVDDHIQKFKSRALRLLLY